MIALFFLGLLINIDQRVTIINELLKSNECYGKKSGEGAPPPPILRVCGAF